MNDNVKDLIDDAIKRIPKVGSSPDAIYERELLAVLVAAKDALEAAEEPVDVDKLAAVIEKASGKPLNKPSHIAQAVARWLEGR